MITKLIEKIRPIIKRIKSGALDTIFPWHCLGCSHEISGDYPLCSDCFRKINALSGFTCPICFKRLSTNKLKPCDSCRPKTSLLALGACAFYSDKTVRQIIHAYKYQNITSLQKPLSRLLINFLKPELTELKNKYNLVLMAVPLNYRKEKTRGYNQSLILTRLISNALTLTIIENNLKRIKNNPPQAEISDYQKRKDSVKNIFCVDRPNEIKTKTILLIDDVFTSGATMEEAAKTLKTNGAKNIIGLVIAKG